MGESFYSDKGLQEAVPYGILRRGRMIKEMTAQELEDSCRTYVGLKTREMNRAKALLACKYTRVEEENEEIRVYDAADPEEIVCCLYENGILVREIQTRKSKCCIEIKKSSGS